MKRTLSLILIIIMVSSLMLGCAFLPDSIRISEVNFYVDGELYTSKTVNMGSSVSAPIAPKKENQIFVGWYSGGIFNYEFDFSNIILGDTNLHAYFVLDAVTVMNRMTTETIKSVVTVENKCYNAAFGGIIETEAGISQGSGVVVDISGGYCFVLTNNHVIEKNARYDKQSITVEDPWGNKYDAYVYQKNASTSPAKDASYDLALIYFKYNPDETKPQLQRIEFGSDPEDGDYVLSLGSPRAQRNAVTVGSVIEYRILNAEEGSSIANINFEVIHHNAIADHGSSGGPLVTPDGKLCGLNFAGYENTKYGCAIPMSKILEFMYQYVY